MTKEQKLFDLVHTHRSNEHYKDQWFIYVDRTLDLNTIADLKEITYRVFLKGGVYFEITRSISAEETEYFFYILWEGPYNAQNVEDIFPITDLLGITYKWAYVDSLEVLTN